MNKFIFFFLGQQKFQQNSASLSTPIFASKASFFSVFLAAHFFLCTIPDFRNFSKPLHACNENVVDQITTNRRVSARNRSIGRSPSWPVLAMVATATQPLPWSLRCRSRCNDWIVVKDPPQSKSRKYNHRHNINECTSFLQRAGPFPRLIYNANWGRANILHDL